MTATKDQHPRPERYVVRREALTPRDIEALGVAEPGAPNATTVHAYALDAAGEQRPIAHHVRHSPTGLNFGYSGSGPSDLARSLLLDYLNETPRSPDDIDAADRAGYLEFRDKFIATADFHATELVISAEEITDWLASRSHAPR